MYEYECIGKNILYIELLSSVLGIYWESWNVSPKNKGELLVLNSREVSFEGGWELYCLVTTFPPFLNIRIVTMII